jgi:uncharacterized protein
MKPNSHQAETTPSPRQALRWPGIAFGLVFPTGITLGYFVLAAGYSAGVQQAAYFVVKTIQFAFPLVWVLAVLREPVRRRGLDVRAVILGVVFSSAVVAAGWRFYSTLLRNTEFLDNAAAKILTKLDGFGIETLWGYALLALFYSAIHSFLEEYYWRWFVFGQLRRVTPLPLAAAVSAIGFASHHVVVLALYFGLWSSATWLLSSAVVIGGLFWAWLYERSGSLFGPWLSHLMIDAGVFWIGYDLVLGALAHR